MPKTAFVINTKTTQKQLIDQAEQLWNEEAALRSTHLRANLWTYAELVAPKSPDQLIKTNDWSWADTFRFMILNGVLKPNNHKDDSAYPYNGLFVSAFYLIEARLFFQQGLTDLAWRDLTQAYYYLGMNSSAMTARESASRAAKVRTHDKSDQLRTVVLSIVEKIAREKPKASIAHVIAQTVKEIGSSPSHLAVLKQFNAAEGSSGPDTNFVLLDGFQNLLTKWSRPTSPYPEIFHAFDPFRHRTLTRSTQI